jgi:hypothetical protein
MPNTPNYFRKPFAEHLGINVSNTARPQTASQLLNLFRCPRRATFCARFFLEHRSHPPERDAYSITKVRQNRPELWLFRVKDGLSAFELSGSINTLVAFMPKNCGED